MSKAQITFTDFHIRKGSIEFLCTTYEDQKIVSKDPIYFHFNVPVKPRNELIAIACSTLCGQKYPKITFDLPVNQQVVREISQFTGAQVQAASYQSLKLIVLKIKNRCINLIRRNGNIILNFSGGFDSLATSALLPRKQTKLVSMDFGGWFEREKKYFVNFHPYIVSTNFRKLKYDRNSWTFMGVGAVLLSDYLKAKYNVFGTILEAARSQIRVNPSGVSSVKTYPFSAAGMTDVRYSNGLTEIGTIMLMIHYYPDQINRSLQSLAAENSEKRFRKQVLTQIVLRKLHQEIPLDLVPPPTLKKASFGSNIATDFLSLYELKYAGLDVVNHTIVDIPPEALHMAESMDLTLFERIHPAFLETIPLHYRKTYLDKLAAAGVVPYTAKDFEEMEIISKFLRTCD
ncbi:MAG TPA: hypothetical protein PKJ47_07130 [Candidatus Limiplasma sp.]|nr:hypothetical protein [Candidatus Limiplasma sp.]